MEEMELYFSQLNILIIKVDATNVKKTNPIQNL